MINTSKKLPGPFLIDLKNRFKEIAGEDQLIDRNEFQDGLKLSNKEITNRLFDIFDKDGSGTIDYNEFIGTIGSIVNGDQSEKIHFAFELHDLDNSGFIDRHELKVLIQQSFIENNLDFDQFQLDLLVEEFFKRADKDKSNTIDFKEFLDVAHDYPDFIEGFAVNPLHWLLPERYENIATNLKSKKENQWSNLGLQVQDISLFKWLLIPRLIFFYNILFNRKKNRNRVELQSISLLPSKVLELAITISDGFTFSPGDYLYLNCTEISKNQWFPFNIIRKTDEGDLVLHIKSNNKWSEKLYDMTLGVIEKDTSLNWEMRIDGPYGESSRAILDTEHAILVGAGNGISRIAPILQDIALRLNNGSENILLKKIDLCWVIEDQNYFEWFTKLLKDIENDDTVGFFNYHIFFIDKSPEEFKERLLYITTNLRNNKTNVNLVDNLWEKSHFGIPDWMDTMSSIRSNYPDMLSSVFFSGPMKVKKSLKKACAKIDLPIKGKVF